jgi:protein-disulfide isomerase
MRQQYLLAAIFVGGVAGLAISGPSLVRRAMGLARPSTSIERSWKSLSSSGHRMGPTNAPVVITEFGDFQCGFCRTTASDLEALKVKYGPGLAVVYRNYPLRRHEFAHQAAEMAECASAQVPFEHVYHMLFADQDSLGVREPDWFATQMGVRDTTRFAACMSEHAGASAIQRDLVAARSIGVDRTPTILVNDLRIMTTPRRETIEFLIDSLLHVLQPR